MTVIYTVRGVLRQAEVDPTGKHLGPVKNSLVLLLVGRVFNSLPSICHSRGKFHAFATSGSAGASGT